jgi:hypothetical protein
VSERRAKQDFGGAFCGSAAAADDSQEMHRVIMESMKKMQAMPMTGDIDHDSAAVMRKHHQSGVEMAEVEMKHGKDSKAKELAKKTAESQKKEIKEYDHWLQSHKSPAKTKRNSIVGARQRLNRAESHQEGEKNANQRLQKISTRSVITRSLARPAIVATP